MKRNVPSGKEERHFEKNHSVLSVIKIKINMELQAIQRKIYTIRGEKVMLDRDLAEMYGVETKNLNLSVKRNLKRFPSDFMFPLTIDEWQSLRLQNETSKRGGRRYLPYAFTEQGVAMLSGLLNSDVAIELNIAVMRAFVAVRQLVSNHPKDKIEELRQYVEEIFADQNDINEDTRMQLELINQTLAEMQTGKKQFNYSRRRIGFIKEE